MIAKPWTQWPTWGVFNRVFYSWNMYIFWVLRATKGIRVGVLNGGEWYPSCVPCLAIDSPSGWIRGGEIGLRHGIRHGIERSRVGGYFPLPFVTAPQASAVPPLPESWTGQIIAVSLSKLIADGLSSIKNWSIGKNYSLLLIRFKNYENIDKNHFL